MENPYEGPSLGGKEENTENRVKTYHTVNKLITISCWTMFGIGYECLYSWYEPVIMLDICQRKEQ